MTRGRLAVGILLAWSLLGGARARALDPQRLLSQYRTQVWGTAEGLPSMSVAQVAQTPDGYLWVGTTEGLARFDGNRFVVFDRANTPAFHLNEIRALFVARSGVLWVGFAGGGLARRDGESFVEVESPESSVLWIGENDRGLWFAGQHGLWRGVQSTIERVPLPVGDPAVSSATIDRTGSLWLRMTDGRLLSQRPGGEFSVMPEPSGPGVGETSRLWVDPEGRGATFAGRRAWVWRGGNWEREPLELPTGVGAGGYILVDSVGSSWIGLYPTGGTTRLHGGQVEIFAAQHPLAVGRFGPMLADREGNLWLGSWTHGLMRLSDGPMVSWSTAEG